MKISSPADTETFSAGGREKSEIFGFRKLFGLAPDPQQEK